MHSASSCTKKMQQLRCKIARSIRCRSDARKSAAKGINQMEILAVIFVSKLLLSLALLAGLGMLGVAGEFGSTIDCALPLESAQVTKTATAHGTTLDLGTGFDARG